MGMSMKFFSRSSRFLKMFSSLRPKLDRPNFYKQQRSFRNTKETKRSEILVSHLQLGKYFGTVPSVLRHTYTFIHALIIRAFHSNSLKISLREIRIIPSVMGM